MNSSGHKYSVFCNLLSLVRLQENQAVSAEDQVENRSPTVATVNSWVKRSLASASIRRKIGAGYALAVGIALLGTSAGLAIGEHYQRQSFAQLTRAHQQEHLLRELQAAILQARSHASRFPVVLGNSLWLQYEKDEFVRSLNKAKATISETERFVNPSSNGATADTEKLQDLLKTAAITIEAYGSLTASLLEQIDPWNLKPDEILPAQQQLLRNSSGEVAITLDRLFHQLNQVIEAAQKEDMQATATLERAGELRVQIIVASMLLSVAIASALAVYTTRAIVQPIRDVTNVAQQVTEESNFALKAPVTSNDEVGVLATSLNQLIQRIAAYTQELKQAEVQLIYTEKMSSLGAMVAGIAHEINNPVNFIYGNLDYISEYIEDLLSLLRLYQQQYPEPLLPIQKQLEVIDFDFLAEDLPKILSSMKGGANRIREIVLSLRNFSRLDEAGMKPVNIHEGIDNTLLILNSRLKQGIKVIKEYGELPLVECTPAPINQVFMNLLCNAIDALEELKVERLKLEGSEDNLQPSNLQSATPCIWIRTEVSGQNSVVIRIADNGSGIASTIKHQIFDPFFTTKNPGKGTGLGLTITYQIITQHQGKIEVNSTPAQGTEFTIMLPIKTSK
ncbi:MAG TPA: ATP-binding protein [Coleofasciculaceae cyanobacterium]